MNLRCWTTKRTVNIGSHKYSSISYSSCRRCRALLMTQQLKTRSTQCSARFVDCFVGAHVRDMLNIYHSRITGLRNHSLDDISHPPASGRSPGHPREGGCWVGRGVLQRRWAPGIWYPAEISLHRDGYQGESALVLSGSRNPPHDHYRCRNSWVLNISICISFYN